MDCSLAKMAVLRRCLTVIGSSSTLFPVRLMHSGLQRSPVLRLKTEIGVCSGRTIMSRYYDGPVPIKERKPKPAQAKTMVKDLEPQAGSSASSQLVSTTTTGDSLAKAPVSSTSDALESRETLQSVLEDLESGREIRQEVLKLVERSKEYSAYEKDVHFEMSVVRRRYAAANEPMTPIRRTQMQAHLAQVQQAIMQEHAEKAAVAFAESLSKDELLAVQSMFGRLEGKGVALEPHDNRAVNMSGVMDKFNQLCDAFMERDAHRNVSQMTTKAPNDSLPAYTASPSTDPSCKQETTNGQLNQAVPEPKLKV